MNALKIASIGAEVALLASTATLAWALVGGSSAPMIVAPMIAALLAVETLRLPLVMRAPKLGFGGAGMALALAAALACLTGETTALGIENLLNERAIGVTAAETRLAEAQTALDAAKAEGSRRTDEIAQAQAAVAAAQAHAEEVGRESVTLQNNPAVAAYRTRKRWTAPGGSAANARAQSDHARRLAAAEADLAAARAALAAVKRVDVKAVETELVAARQGVERVRAGDPMHRLAAAINRVGTADLTAAAYESVRRVAILSIAAIVSFGTLIAGLISSLPDRSSRRDGKLSRSIRAYLARRRKPIVVRRDVPGPVEFRDRIVVKWVPFNEATGHRIKSDGEPGEVISPTWAQKS